ncbi:MAG: class I SAM-dependent methyltransferase [Chloroflexi bacterium]|nr:class I SAM-dependent methyltransferase [Chloroflexota bacterium]MCC6895262.1 class I SAM-dependent methyltransferase [Anaerolineae bacterium]
MFNFANDPQAVGRMYETDESLRIRQETHELYSQPKLDFTAWAVDSVKLRGDERILDIGSGPGRYYTALHDRFPNIDYHACDLHGSMVKSHPYKNTLVLADAQRLPYANASFDVVMANHMLFHVPDVMRALRELRRVVKPNGFVMATTNSIHTMPEFQALMRRAITLLSPPGTANVRVPGQHTDPFTLESGTRLFARHFEAVVRYDLPRSLVFPSAEPALAYLNSTRSVREAELPQGVSWDEMMMIVREQIGRLIDHFGELSVNTLSGLLVATDRGDFITGYYDQLSKIKEQTKPFKESPPSPKKKKRR